jgi:hypothetical protein
LGDRSYILCSFVFLFFWLRPLNRSVAHPAQKSESSSISLPCI